MSSLWEAKSPLSSAWEPLPNVNSVEYFVCLFFFFLLFSGTPLYLSCFPSYLYLHIFVLLSDLSLSSILSPPSDLQCSFFYQEPTFRLFFIKSAQKTKQIRKKQGLLETRPQIPSSGKEEENTGKYRSVEFTPPLTVAFQYVVKNSAAKALMGNYN